MSWDELTYCKVSSGLTTASRDFIEDAFWLIQNMESLFGPIESFFSDRGESGNAYKRHLDGTLKMRVQVRDLASLGAGIVGHTDTRGSTTPGKISFDTEWFRCIRDRYEDSSLSIGSRTCALIDLAATGIIHETGHVVYRGERWCGMVEGFWRHEVQDSLGYFHGGVTSNSSCGQVSWSCGARGDLDDPSRCSKANVDADERSLPEATSLCPP